MPVSTRATPELYLTGSPCLKLAAIPNAAGTARRFAAALLRSWGLAGLLPEVQLVTSELVTNAVQAVGITETHPSYVQLQKARLISLCLYRHNGLLVIEVWDPSTEPPVPTQAGPEDEGGRGLLLVQCCTESFGYRRPQTGGKIVWCTLATGYRE